MFLSISMWIYLWIQLKYDEVGIIFDCKPWDGWNIVGRVLEYKIGPLIKE